MKDGLILVNTGPGKGKTTAALGTAIRALGHGKKVAFLQFIKSQETGESRFLKDYALKNPGTLYYNRLGLGFVGDNPTAEDRDKAALALSQAQELVAGDYDLIVLDEICVAMAKKIVAVSEVVELIKNKPSSQHLILTGRGCPQEIIELAHTVTEMQIIKHAMDQGIVARRGIEF